MAIAFGNNAQLIQTGYAAGGARTWSHTNTAGNVLVVCVGLWQDVAGTGTITGITYNGVAMTKANAVTSGAMRAETWYLFSPATGTNTVSATISGDTDDRKFASMSFTGADTSAIDSSTNATGSGSPITVDNTTVTDNSWVIDAAMKFGTEALTVGTGQTDKTNDNTGSTAFGASYEGPKTPAGAVTMSWTTTGSNDWAQATVGIKPAAAGVSPSASRSPSASASASLSPSASRSPSSSVSASTSPSASRSPSSSISASVSPSASRSPSSSTSASSSPSASVSSSVSPSGSTSPSSSTSVSASVSPSASASPSSSVSASASPSSSASPSASASLSPAEFTPTNTSVTAARQTDSLTITRVATVNIAVIE